MRTAIIYVFSGTGNTLATAKMTASSFEQRGIKTTVCRVRAPFKNTPIPVDFDYAGFAYPVHAFNTPRIFIDFVKSLPDSDNKAFILKTSGEPFHINDASSRKLYELLLSKGFDVTLDRHLLMPYNIVFRYKASLVKQMYQYNEKLCDILVQDLLSGKRDDMHFKLRHKIFSAIFKIQQPGAILNGRLYSTNKQCNMCLKCVRECPSGNISVIKGKLKFDAKCTMCMRCVMHCPRNAVNFGLLRPLKINGAYDFKRILADDNIKGNYINENTKGYFRFFKNYYRKADRIIKETEENEAQPEYKRKASEG